MALEVEQVTDPDLKYAVKAACRKAMFDAKRAQKGNLQNNQFATSYVGHTYGVYGGGPFPPAAAHFIPGMSPCICKPSHQNLIWISNWKPSMS